MAHEYTLVVMGAGGVGKSAITVQFIHDKFLNRYDPTVEDSYRKVMVVDGESCTLDIMDTAGQDEYKALLDQYMKNGQGFLLVYSQTSLSSFEATDKFYNAVTRVHSDRPPMPMVLIANKYDLEDQREVFTPQGEEWAKKRKTGFLEVSAKTKHNVVEAFESLVKRVNEWRELHPEFAPHTKKLNKTGKRLCVLF